MTLNLATLSITTHSLMDLIATLSMNDNNKKDRTFSILTFNSYASIRKEFLSRINRIY
jgi:hypothetical protein